MQDERILCCQQRQAHTKRLAQATVHQHGRGFRKVTESNGIIAKTDLEDFVTVRFRLGDDGKSTEGPSRFEVDC